jgi:hypothetical protein
MDWPLAPVWSWLPPGFFFSAEISEIWPKTGFIGDHRYFQIPNDIFQYSKNMFKF